MAVTFTAERAETVTTTNGATHTFTGFTPTAGSLLVAVILGTDTAASFVINSIDGTGLTWTDSGIEVVRNDGTVFLSGELWWATTTGAATGTITVTHAESITGFAGWIGEFAGADTTAPIKQTAKNETGTTDPNVSLSVAPDSDSLCVAAYAGFIDANQVAEAGWSSQLAVDTLGTPTWGFGIWVSTAADQTFTAAGTDGNHYAFIAEIDAAAATASLPSPRQFPRAILVR